MRIVPFTENGEKLVALELLVTSLKGHLLRRVAAHNTIVLPVSGLPGVGGSTHPHPQFVSTDARF